MRAPECRLPGGLCYLSTLFWLLPSSLQIIFTSSCSHRGFHIWLQLHTASSSSLYLLDPSWVLLLLHRDENGGKDEHYLFMVSAAWNSTMGRVLGLKKPLHKGEKQPGLHWWRKPEMMEPNIPYEYLREESCSFSQCWFVAVCQKTCEKGIGVDRHHDWSHEGSFNIGIVTYVTMVTIDLNFLLLGSMSADFILHIYKISAAILIPTSR